MAPVVPPRLNFGILTIPDEAGEVVPTPGGGTWSAGPRVHGFVPAVAGLRWRGR
jgi:hypothetical protein